MLHIKLKGITNAATLYVANILPADTSGSCGWVKCQNSTFSEHGHVAYKIEGITNAATR